MKHIQLIFKLVSLRFWGNYDYKENFTSHFCMRIYWKERNSIELNNNLHNQTHWKNLFFLMTLCVRIEKVAMIKSKQAKKEKIRKIIVDAVCQPIYRTYIMYNTHFAHTISHITCYTHLQMCNSYAVLLVCLLARLVVRSLLLAMRTQNFVSIMF